MPATTTRWGRCTTTQIQLHGPVCLGLGLLHVAFLAWGGLAGRHTTYLYIVVGGKQSDPPPLPSVSLPPPPPSRSGNRVHSTTYEGQLFAHHALLFSSVPGFHNRLVPSVSYSPSPCSSPGRGAPSSSCSLTHAYSRRTFDDLTSKATPPMPTF